MRLGELEERQEMGRGLEMADGVTCLQELQTTPSAEGE